MKDSRFIASGAYGCIYHPPYDCKGKDLKDTSFVTKLVKNDYTSQTEYDVSNLLKGKDGFLLIQKKCSITSKNIKRTMAKDCDLIEKKDPHIDSKYLLLYSKFINGEELVDYMKDNFTINKMMKSFCFLCKQIETLIDCKIIHHDLHFGNIMYNYKENTFVVIDFGLAIIADKFYVNQELNMPYLKNAIFHYTPTWQYFAIEEHLLGYLIHKGNITEDIIKVTIDEYLSDHIIQTISPEYYNQYKEESFRYFKKFVNKPKDLVIKKFLSFWTTWDYYKIALHNIKMYNRLKINFPELFMLLLLMIHPIPKYRPNVVEMNNNIQTLLKCYSPKIKYMNQFDETLTKELSHPLTM
jgi:serine/threonine protein kinase